MFPRCGYYSSKCVVQCIWQKLGGGNQLGLRLLAKFSFPLCFFDCRSARIRTVPAVLSSRHRVLNPSVRHMFSRLQRGARLTAEIRSPKCSERGETVNPCLIQNSLKLETCYGIALRIGDSEWIIIHMHDWYTDRRGTQFWIHNDRKRASNAEWFEKDRIICGSFTAAYVRLWSRKMPRSCST